MNDFTKEELVEMSVGIAWWLEGDCCEFNSKLIDKLQSMIENYCEHESAHIDYNHQALRCNQCEKIVE